MASEAMLKLKSLDGKMVLDNTYLEAIKGLSQEQAQLALSTTKLSQAKQNEILINAGYVASSKNITYADLEEILTKEKLDNELKESILLKYQEANAETGQIVTTKVLTQEEIKELLALEVLDEELKENLRLKLLNVGGNISLAGSFKLLTAKIWGAVKAIGSFLFTNPVGWAILVAGGIASIVGIINLATTSTKEYEEQLEELKQECSEVESELSSIKSELKTIIDRITELQNKGTLTFTEKEEYDNLVKQSNELQRQNDLLEEQLRFKNQEKNKTFVDTMNSESKGEVNTVDENGNDIKLVGKDKMKYHDDFVLTNLTHLIDKKATVKNQEELDSIKNAIDTYTETAMKRYEEYVKRAEGISYINEPSTEDEKKVNEWLDFIEDYKDKMMISLGNENAKTNAFNRLVDNWYFDDTVQELQDLGEQGEVTADMLNNQKYSEFINKLVEIGVIDSADNLADIAIAFNKVAESVNNTENTFNKLTITKTVDAINNKLKPALDSLAGIYTTLFDKDNGYEWQIIDVEEFASIKSELDSLKEEFGIDVPTEDYEEFVKILSNTETTAEQAQQAFDDLATSMINNSNVVELTDENFDVLRNSLENLGVTNANEVLEEMRQIKEELAIAGIDLENVTYEEVTAFINSANASDTAKEYLELYYLKKLALNNNPLNTIKDIEALENECKGLRITNALLEKTAKLKSLVYANQHFSVNNLSQIEKTQDEINDILNNQHEYEVDFKYDGNTTGDNKDKSSSKDTKETFDWIETLISRIQRNITNLGKVVSATYRNWSTRNNSLAQEMSEVNKEISAQMTAYNTYMQKANSVPLAEGYKELVRSGAYNISEITDENLKEQIQEYEEWYNKALDASDAIEDLRANLAELAKTNFDNISAQYDDKISLITHNISMIEELISQSEAAGYMASEVYYKAMSEKQQENIAQLQEEYSSLLSAFDEAVKSGSIEKYSSDWYEMLSSINDVELEIQSATTELIEFNQTLQQLSWEVFDRIQDSVSGIAEEANFLIDVLDSKDLHTDKGVITDEGLAVQGLHAVNYNTYMEQALAYADEMSKIEAEMAKDPYDMELVDRRNELLGLQQEAIQNAISEKEAIHSLWEDGYSKMLDSLQKVIDKRKELLQSTKDMYDYENTISEKTSNIASLKKQLQAYSGDNSESAKATIQKLQLSLSEAEKDLEQTEYEKYLSDQEQMLDTLYNQTEQWVNERLDNLDGLVAEAVDATNKNAETISATIREVSSAYGYELSEQMESIWNSNNEVVSIYGDILYGVGQELLVSNTNITNAINGGTTNVINAIDGLNTSMQTMVSSLNGMANTNRELINQVQTIVANGQNSSYGGNNNANDYTVSTGGSSSNASTNNEPKKHRAIVDGVEIGSGYSSQSAAQSAVDAEISKRAEAKAKAAREEAKKRGVSGSPLEQIYINTRNSEASILRMNSKTAYYATGTKNAKRGLGIFGEAGDEILVEKDGSILLSSGATLYPFQGGETVYNAKDTSEMLSNALAPLNISDFNKISPNMSGIIRNTGGDVNQDISVNFALPNVTDANSLINELQQNKRFEKVIQSMTTDVMLGKNSLNKYKH